MLELRTIAIAAMLAAVAPAGCSGDDAEPEPGGGGRDAGPDSDGGDSRAGRGGSGGRGGGSGSGGSGSTRDGGGADDEDGGGEPTAGTGGASGQGGDAGQGEAGASGMAGAGGAGGEPAMDPVGCMGLMECCAELPEPDRASCNVIASNADDATCEQFTALFCVPEGGADGACAALNECCETLPRGPLRVACATTVMTGMAIQCNQVMTVFCMGSGDPGACQTLSACCDGLDTAQARLCRTIVQQGQTANCETAELLFCQ